MTCQSCGLESPTKDVTLHQNIGMLMLRRSQTIKGSLCKPCIDSYFWRFTVVNAMLGWWGLLSLIMTPIFIINNVFQFIGSRGLGETYTGTRSPSSIAQCPHCQSTQTAPAKLPGALFASGVVAGLLLLWSIAVEATYLQGRGAPGNLVAGIVIFALAVIAALGLWMALRYRLWACRDCRQSWVPRKS
ncbi:MAG: hypothetical protein ABIV47_02015 [Roseiflexaceae bacterium]